MGNLGEIKRKGESFRGAGNGRIARKTNHI